MENLIEAYGYWAVLLGTLLEGETLLVLGGLAAHRGYLSLPYVIAVAFIGSFAGDQLFFYLGRRHREFIYRYHPQWKIKLKRAQNLIQRFQTPLILSVRFLYGLRTVLPFAIGISSVPFLQFAVLNAIGAAVWAIAVGVAGYFLGNVLEMILGNLKRHEIEIFCLIAILGAITWCGYFWNRHRKQNPS